MKGFQTMEKERNRYKSYKDLPFKYHGKWKVPFLYYKTNSNIKMISPYIIFDKKLLNDLRDIINEVSFEESCMLNDSLLEEAFSFIEVNCYTDFDEDGIKVCDCNRCIFNTDNVSNIGTFQLLSILSLVHRKERCSTQLSTGIKGSSSISLYKHYYDKR